MKKCISLLILAILFVLPGFVQAEEFGFGSLITVPTADILQETELNLNYQRIGDGDIIGANYGIRQGVQLGIDICWIDGLDDGDMHPKLKVNLLQEDNGYRPQLSIGVNDHDYYLVASKMTSYYNLRAHLGIAEDDLIEDNLFIGVSKVLNPVTITTNDNSYSIPVTTLMAEYNNGLNLGAKCEFDFGAEVNLGVLDFDEFTFGIGFKNNF